MSFSLEEALMEGGSLCGLGLPRVTFIGGSLKLLINYFRFKTLELPANNFSFYF